MRYSLLALFFFSGLTACNKNKFTTAPQITYRSIKPNVISGNLPLSGQTLPVLSLHITDAEGDIGFKNGSDSAYIYVRNLLSNTSDSFEFPNLGNATYKNFQCDVDITINTYNLLKGSTRTPPKTDTLFFEAYVKDFAKNKSNTITTTDPVFFVFQ